MLGGWLADLHGLSAPLLLQAGCAIVVGVIGLGLIETAPLRTIGRSNLTAVRE